MRLALLLQAVAFVTVLGGAHAASADDEFLRFRLGPYELHIPERNAVSDAIPAWLRWLPGLDDGSRSVMYMLHAQDIQENIPDFQTSDGDYVDNIRGIVTALTPIEVSRYKDPRQFAELSDLWFATGAYENRVVRRSKITGLYDVFYDDGYRSGWALLSRYPDPNEPLPDEPLDFLVAHCVEGGRPIGQTGRGVNCRSHVLLGDIAVEFRLSGYNVHLIDEVRQFIKRTVSGWIVDRT